MRAYDTAGNPGTWSAQVTTTIDISAPTSQASVPATSQTADFDVTWSGSDECTPDPCLPSGIVSYDVQYKDGDGAWIDWQTGDTDLSATFTGQMKHTYHFQSRARDLAGHVEPWPTQPDASTKVGPKITKYYYHGGKRVAMRVDEPGGSAVYYLHGDHLGSTSLTTDASGAVVARQLYHPYGTVRYSEGALPTDFGFAGQREDGSTGLVFMHARYYHPALARWTQADTIVPNPGNPQDLNRYAYVRNNPLRYTDPSGHCIPGLDCPDEAIPFSNGSEAYGVDFTGTWHARDKVAAFSAVATIGGAMTRLLIQRNRQLVGEGNLGQVEYVPDPTVLFRQVFGMIDFHQSAEGCSVGCWAETWIPRITIYTNAPDGGYTSQNAAHELGHAFAQRTNRQPYNDLNASQVTYVDPETDDIIPVAGGGWDTGYLRTDLGYAGPFPGWQQSTGQTANEDFADMFLGWSYNHFADAAAGTARYQWMTTNMADWIALARY